jgi:hypothetical protein
MKAQRATSFKHSLIISAVCTAIFGLIIACSGNMNTIINPGNGPGATFTAIMAHNTAPGNHSHVFGSTSTPSLAAFFAPAATPSDVPESFEIDCTFPPGFISSVAPGSFIPLAPANDGTCQQSEPQIGNFVITAQPTFHAGTAEKLVVTGVSGGGVQIRCSDLTTQTAVADQEQDVPYLVPSTGAITVFNGTTNLGFSCTLNTPNGDSPAKLVIRYAKV